jgi:hypothetical protein
MKMPLADVLDRLTICKLKKIVGKKNVDAEINDLEDDLFQLPSHPNGTDKYITSLLIWNSMIWANEAAIRDAQKVKKLSTEEVGRRALAIRKYNRERMKVKREIAEWAGEAVDVKVQHASE